MAKGRSEFAGEDGPSGMPRHKPHRRLTASEKLRLIYTTGTEDVNAKPSTRAWRGDGLYDPYVPPSRIPPPDPTL